MYKNLPENIFLPELEKKVLEFWKKDKTFEKSVSSKNSGKHFTFYEGPPTANGHPGIHHVISRTVKDMICRYKAMNGYKVIRKAGWDTQGLPVEVEVEKQLGIKSKQEIEDYGAVEFNQKCKESIFMYLKEWEDLTERMGYWINLKDAYVTYHNDYIESVWWALKRFYDDGKIYKGFKILPFCPVCESPLSSHEVAQGYQDLKDPSVFVKFQILSGEFKGSDFLVWTTTPWTLISNSALCVNPDFDYVKIKTSKDENLILAKERLTVIQEEYSIEKEFKGKDLERTEYAPLYEFLKDEKKGFYVTNGDFVTIEDGSGIVHIAPAFGEDDYQIGIKYDLPFFQAVGKDGLFTEEVLLFKGKNFKAADPEIILDLKSKGRLYKKEMFVHSYPHCWRHHVPLMYYATDSWFIKTTAYKDKMLELNKSINWHPETFGSGRFGKWLEENKDWAISRNRFWGTPLPIWFYTDESGQEHYECIGSLKELTEKAVNFNEVYKNVKLKGKDPVRDKNLDLHKPYIDEVIIRSKDGHEMKRVKQVIDCWFDSGSMPFAQYHFPFENKEAFEANYPADFIAEGIDQTRGWFYSMHAIGTFLFDKPAYSNLIVNGLILDKFGKKMSKSMGNAINPFELMESYGADVLRWYLISSSPIGNSKLFNEEDLSDIQNKFFDTLINTVRFFIIYSNLVDFDYEDEKITKPEDRDILDRWILSELNTLKKNYSELMDDYDITKATRLLYDFTLDELSNWYIRRNRKRFRNPHNEKDKQAGYQTLYEVIIELLKMIAPVSPFISEMLYGNLTGNGISIHLTEFTVHDTSVIDKELESEMKLAQDIVYLVRSMRVKNNLKVRQPLQQILVPVLDPEDYQRLLNIKEIVLEEVNVKELNIIEGDSDIIIKKAKPNFKSIGPKFGKDVKRIQLLINNLTSSQISELEKKGSLQVEDFAIQSDDVELYTENIEGWIVESYNGITIALDTKLDETLRDEGIVREFINRVQNYRRTNDFEVSDKIKIYLKTPENINSVLLNYEDYIKDETLTEKILSGEGKEFEFLKTEINGDPCEIYIQKAI